MLISIVLIFIISYCIYNTSSIQRRYVCLLAFCIYAIYSSYDLWWLIRNENWPFHPSDPSAYYTSIEGLRFKDVLSIDSSNTFYYIINWINWKIWDSPYFCSVILRIDNILAYLVAYLMLTYKNDRVSYIDYLILFNPFAIITLVRNVRDIYILIFVLLTLIGLGLIPKYRSNLLCAIIGIFLILITRSVLLLPIFVVYFYNKRKILSKATKLVILTSTRGCTIIFFPVIFRLVANQMISAIDYAGEDIEAYLPLLDGNISFPVLRAVIVRLFIGAISMLFTPHPIKFVTNWMSSSEWNHIVGIYTLPDNSLIFLGSIFNYLFIIPLVFFLIYNYKNVNQNLLLFALCFIILYVVSYLGIVDIRNRNTAVFFILASLYYSSNKVHLTIKHYVLSLVAFLGLCVV